MKIQCACGTKLAFDITPDMAVTPVQCICPECGADNSAAVNQLIRQELGVSAAPLSAPPAAIPVVIPLPPPVAAPPAPMRIALPVAAPVAAPAPAPAPRPAIRISTHTSAPAPAATESPAVPMGKEFCLKHPGHQVTHKCVVCGKPMCPECMALFGYVCSPLCKNKAETRRQEIPVYAFQKSIVAARRWRKIGLIGGSIGAVVALIFGVWFWYAWFGCVPKVAYALGFPDKVKSGEVQLAGANDLVYLHGGELGRVDMKQPQPVWTAQLVDKKKFTAQAEKFSPGAGGRPWIEARASVQFES